MPTVLTTLLLVAACAPVGSPSPTETADTGGDAATCSGSGRRVSGTLTFVDAWYGAPIAGLGVVLADVEGTTDAAGSVALDAPADASCDLLLDGDGRPSAHLYVENGDPDFYGTIPVPSTAALNDLAASFGVTRDPALATLAFSFVDALSALDPVRAPGYGPVVPAAYELAVVADAAASSGYSEGESSLEGAPATFVYFNVTPGEVELTTTGDCARWAFPSGDSTALPLLAAGELTLVHYTTDCD